MALYDDVLAIAFDYMGPAAQEYMDRRIRIVLRGEDPRGLPPEKLERLAAGVEMTAKFYMSETRTKQFIREIRALEYQ
jgi:hypothetical protein